MSNKRIKAVINETAIKDNIKFLYSHINKEVPIMCVIKANAYGHGAVRLGKIYEGMDEVCGYAVATAEEAIELRKSGLLKKILILGATFEDDFDELIENNIDLTVFTIETAIILNDHALKLGKSAQIHIKVDTGMSRIGLTPDKNGLNIIKSINELSNINIEGLFTHFAKADELNKDSAYNQLDKYNYLCSLLIDEGIDIPIKHCSNSAAILELPAARFDMVRAGIVLYGLWPSDEIIKDNVNLKPAMSLVSHIVYIKDINEGTSVSYGGTFTANASTKVATIPVGYADGYPRSLSNIGKVIINNEYCPIIGRVCMDQMMVDVSKLNNVSIGDEVILLGTMGDKTITAEELGDMSSRFNYELVCDFTNRVAREYVD